MAQPSLSSWVCWLSRRASLRMVCLCACERACWFLYMCRTGKRWVWVNVCVLLCMWERLSAGLSPLWSKWELRNGDCDEDTSMMVFLNVAYRLFKENLYPNWMKEEDKLQPNPGNQDWHISANGSNLVSDWQPCYFLSLSC